ncbi:contactin [Octopus sinensis]|uniref:Contactin n=1 Tax=Octopus sinensis TaxID=2607531 RepID=A0A6P7SEN2_9MOLL|nr:contactin [Octopus sinensis]XP_029636620.1 contactin [Octopus sinensis]XP_036358900.1 contactin [Octopus sinensis]
MPSLAMPLILVFLACFSLQTLADCPNQWQKYSDSCYNFIMNSLKSIDMAKEECSKYGATLVSVNSQGENNFLTSYFGQNKLTGFTWYTSGEYIGNNNFRWLGDGQDINSQTMFWANDARRNGTGRFIIYVYHDGKYSWIRDDGQTQRSSICEIPEKESYRIYNPHRSFDFGQHLNDMNNIQRGPKAKREPMNVLAIMSPPSAYMEFTAFGNPPPVYSWYRGNTAVSSTLGSRYTLTNGRLTISDLKAGVDDTNYRCMASNDYGKIMSRTVQFTLGFLGEFLNTPREGNVANSYEGTYLQCKPPNHKPALRYQWSFNENVNFVRPDKNPYLFISRNGNLYFSEVTQSDAGSYFCMVALTIPENYKPFKDTPGSLRTSMAIQLNINNKGARSIKPQMQADFPAIFPDQALEGGPIQIECFAYGTYTLDYSWFRVGSEMPKYVKYEDHKRVLIFPKASVSDSGTYICTVTNAYGSDTATVHLDVKVRPHFKTEMKDQLLDIGSQLTWQCEAHAKPAAVYSWYKNGEQMKSVSGRVIVHNNIMTILKISKEDDGMYQCEAKNDYGSALSAGQLRVLELKPEFWSNPLQPSTLAAEQGNVTLPCKPEAAPYPTIEWFKNGMSLGLTPGSPSNRYTLYHNGDLLITDIMSSDGGTYKCEATNRLGTASTETLLSVKRSTVISIKPRNTKVIFNETAVLKCRASYPKELDAVYTWSFNGYDIQVKAGDHYGRGEGDDKGDLYIKNAGFRHAGHYLCQVKTIIGTTSAGAYLTVIGPPGRPQGLAAQKVLNQKESLQLAWFDGRDNDAPITYYIIEFQTNFTSIWELFGPAIPRHLVEVNTESGQLRTTIHGLIPAVSYRFRMGAINKYGTGEKSLSSSWIKIDPDAPRKAPEEVGGGGGKVSTLVITWKPLLHQDHNGKNFGYRVFWRKKRDAFKPEHIWSLTNVSGSISKLVIQIEPQNYYTQYEVQVQARNNIGMGPNSTIVTIYSAEDLPAITVTNVKGYAYNATAIKVTWTPVKEDRKTLKGKLRGYKIKYWKSDLNELRSIEAIHYGQAEEALLIGLLPNTYYNFRMMVFNSAGFGPISDEYFAKTYHKPPHDYPTEVQILPLSSDSCIVAFRGVSTQSDEEPLQGYLVKYWLVNDDIRQALQIDLGREVQGEIRNLRKGVVYNLRVIGYSRGGEGAKSSPVTQFTITKGGQVQGDMFNPLTTHALLAGSSRTTFTLTICCLSLLLSQLYTLFLI